MDVWYVHDGFLCAVRISRPGLEKFISDETGYVIRFDESELCKSEDISLAYRPSQSCINDLHSSALLIQTDASSDNIDQSSVRGRTIDTEVQRTLPLGAGQSDDPARAEEPYLSYRIDVKSKVASTSCLASGLSGTTRDVFSA